MNTLIARAIDWLKPRKAPLTDIQRAKQFISAIDAGGIPLDPSRITRIAEDLGLEVSKKARKEDTIERIRQAIERY